jgi:sulfonate transport system ATP-binding protein
MSATLATGAAVNLWGVQKSFGATSVLRDISLHVEPGAFVTIIGQSGCGKSTLLRLLAGLDTPDHGELRLDDEPLAAGQEHVRLMFQEPRLLPWASVLDNIGLGLTGDWRARAKTLLQDVGLETRAASWPSTLSGGQKQRVALARALVAQPRLLLMDEPLGALDALTRLAMQALITRIWQIQKFTAILVTHDVHEAVTLGDHVILLERGRIAETWHITTPRPRDPGDAELPATEAKILRRLLQSPTQTSKNS